MRPVVAGLEAFCSAVCLALAASGACAQTVTMSGSMGSKALLVIDGKTAVVATGDTVRGVKVLSVSAQETQVEVGGKRMSALLGGSPVNLGGGNSEGSGTQIVMTADSRGHFFGMGSINGRTTRMLVDTGASSVAIGQAEADRLGIKYRDGIKGIANTAGGQVAVFAVTLAVVRVGDVDVREVPAVVLASPMNFVLLGNSFLTRFQMRRDNEQLTLVKR